MHGKPNGAGDRDAEGQPIEVTIHPATLQVLEIESDDDDD